MYIQKRDKSVTEFDISKIKSAVCKAYEAVYCKSGSNQAAALNEVDKVADQVMEIIGSQENVTVEQVQDVVEKVLVSLNFDVARAYIMYRGYKQELRNLQPDPNAIMDYIHRSKYARYLPLLKRRETYEETVLRRRNMDIDKFPEEEANIRKYYELVLQRKVLPSMRSMQFAGPAIAEHNARMYNCSYTLIDRPRVFQEIFYLLLCGCGVGYSVQKQHVAKLPMIVSRPTNFVVHHKVKDDIAGWADTVGLVIDSFLSGYYIEFDYSEIRPEGSILKVGGGKAPGHIPLKLLVENLTAILEEAVNRQLTTLECHDMICHIADAVLAGGIRRSSLIALFSKDDNAMLNCKSPSQFNYYGLNSHRAMANNSVVLLRSEATREDFDKLMALNLESYGEPGFMFTNNLDHGMNPCGEIGLDPTSSFGTGFGFCNLCEVNCANCETEEEFLEACEAAAYIGTLQATYTDFWYLSPASKEIAERDRLLGVGLTGIMDRQFTNKVISAGARLVVATNKTVAERLGINPASRCTTVKPSGTSSLILGCVGSGIHPHHAKRYFRRVTANRNEPIAQYLRKINPHMVVEKPNGDWCITFPVQAPDRAVIRKKASAKFMLDTILKYYKHWILEGMADPTQDLTHNISATISYKDSLELEELLLDVWANRHSLKALSFFPECGDKGVPFIPREEVLEEDFNRWKSLIGNYSPVDYTQMIEEEDATSLSSEIACSNGACELVHTEFTKAGSGEYGKLDMERTDGKIFSMLFAGKIQKVKWKKN